MALCFIQLLELLDKLAQGWRNGVYLKNTKPRLREFAQISDPIFYRHHQADKTVIATERF